jgi:hypothetical protein
MASDVDQISLSAKQALKTCSEQKARIADLKSAGADTSEADRLLRMLESDLHTFEDLLKELRRQRRKQSHRRLRPELV